MPTRRAVLRTASAAALGGMSGCVVKQAVGRSDDQWDPEVTGDEPELSPGEQSSVEITAGPLRSFRLKLLGDIGLRNELPDGPVQFDFSQVTIEPRPSGSFDSMPPIWTWGSQVDVTVSLPVHAADDAPMGDYRYAVTIGESGGLPVEEERMTEEFTITVVGE